MSDSPAGRGQGGQRGGGGGGKKRGKKNRGNQSQGQHLSGAGNQQSTSAVQGASGATSSQSPENRQAAVGQQLEARSNSTEQQSKSSAEAQKSPADMPPTPKSEVKGDSQASSNTPGQQGPSPQAQQQNPQQQGAGKKTQGPSQKPPGDQSSQKNPGSQSQDAPQKSKAQLRAERRAVQEAQRAAKAAGGGGGGKKAEQPKQQQQQQQQPHVAVKKTESSQGGKEPKRIPDHMIADDEKKNKRAAKRLEKHQIPKRTDVQKKVGFFQHLNQYEREVSLTKKIKFSSGSIHPAILRLGLQYAEGVVCGSNARCLALLGALYQVIKDYKTPPHTEFSRDLDNKISPCITFLDHCRPLSISMGNAIRHLKWQINHIPSDMQDMEAKDILFNSIAQYRRDKIELPGEAISSLAFTKIADGDIIMVYGCSSLIRKVLVDAHKKGAKFQVVVVDGRPKLEGKKMLQSLIQSGIQCSYVLISAASYVMKEVTKVFIGAHALLANGYVMSRVGSSQVAMVAKSHNVPVLVCCETYKFCERVQTDSFVFNELGDPDDLVQTDKKPVHLSDWRDMKNLNLLNLVYDVTPSELVSLVITEVGMVPCTSVPVVLRVKHVECEAT